MRNQPIRVLLIEDDPEDADYLQELLSEAPNQLFTVEHADRLRAGLEYVVKADIDVILLDLSLPDSHPFDTFGSVHVTAADVPIVVMSGFDNEELTVRAVQEGAQDYLVKGQIDSNVLVRVLRYAVERHRLRRAMEQQTQKLQANEARLRKIIGQNADGIVVLDKENIVRFVNPAAEALLGRKSEELVDTLFGHPMVMGKTQEIDIPRSTGETVIAEIRVVETEWDGESACLASLRDVTERKDIEAKLEQARQLERYLAYHDILTGLPNRQLFYDRLHQAVVQAKRHAQLLAVLFLDLDGFKRINDTLGHSTGDQLLQCVAQRLKACVRESDTVARLGGDEFTVILDNITQMQDSANVAQKILEALSKSFVVAEHKIFITISIGISIYPSDGTEIETLVKNADIAMYRAKENGKNNYRLYNLSMSSADTERLRMESSLRQTLEKDELVVYYQPQVDLSTGEITAVEALVRWQHPEFGLLPPKRFIPLAEETGLIVPIGEWVLRTACEQSQTWQDAGLPSVPVAVNLSAHQFREKTLVGTIARVLSETGLRPDHLDLEIPESNAMQDVDYTIATLQVLKKMGVQFSVDDFGVGYSSLGDLKRFPINKLKTSRSFLKGVPANHDDVSIITAIVAMAHSMGLKVVAEGVETEEQLTFLRSIQCEEMQGFLFSRALPADTIAKRLQTGAWRIKCDRET